MPSTSAPSRLTDLAASLDTLLSWVRRHAPTAGYSMTARSTMARLLTDGPGRISDLARLEGVSQPAMTGLVNRLEGEHLVRREPHPSDARAAFVVLTDVGARFVAERRADRGRRLAAQLERLSSADQQALLAAIPALDRLAALPQENPLRDQGRPA